jgi:hypothetical protein
VWAAGVVVDPPFFDEPASRRQVAEQVLVEALVAESTVQALDEAVLHRQRCRVHFMRNALAYAGKNGRRVVSAFIATAFAQDDEAAAKAQWRRVADQLRPKLPKLAALMDEAEADVLAFVTFPKDHRPKIHSTNPLERINGEIKRRTESLPSGLTRGSSASSPMRRPSHAWSAPSCSSRTMSGPSNATAT